MKHKTPRHFVIASVIGALGISLSLAMAFHTKPSANSIRNLASYLEKHPMDAARFQSKIQSPFSPALFDISLQESKTYPVSSPQLRRRLEELNSQNHSGLMEQIEALHKSLSTSQIEEKLRLLEITRIMGEISGSGRINQILIDQSEAYANSGDPQESELSRLALQYYLNLETDTQLKRIQVGRFVSAFIHSPDQE